MRGGSIKSEVRILGLDDAPFDFKDEETEMIGTVFRGGSFLDGVLAFRIKVDGSDSTGGIIECVNRSAHRKQLRVIMLDGITFGGFNVADIKRINEETGIPVIAVVRDKPGMESIRKALGRFKDSERRWELIKKAGPVKPLSVKNPKTGKKRNIWFQASGIDDRKAAEVIKVSSTRSFIPEPLRVAHLMGHAVKELK
jgi:endonuclease V-like protein UPF0215 family